MSDFPYLISTQANLNNILKVDFYHQASILVKFNNIPKVAACYLTSILINTNDIAEDLTVYYQVYIYEFSSFLPISYLKLKQS